MRHDLRQGVRGLWAKPGLTLAAVLTLTLGIGANIAIFSVVNAVLLRPLPFERPDELVIIWDNFLRLGMERLGPSPAEFFDYRERRSVFADVGAFRQVEYNVTGPNADPERVIGGRVSANLFPLLGVRPGIGRLFAAEDDQAAASRVALISESLWRRRYNADPNLRGQIITLNNVAYEVIGVMPQDFRFPDETLPNSERADVWTPAVFTPEELRDRGLYQLRVIARLNPGVTLAQARSDMDVFGKQLEEQYPGNYRGPKGADGGWKITVFPLSEEAVGDAKLMLWVLLGAVGFVLLIACANVANLLLVRATARRKEFAVRTALGASRWRIVRQLLTESLLLSALGGAAGLLVALWSIDLLASFAARSLPRLDGVSLDGRVLAFAFIVSLATGLIFGLVPALQAARTDISESLKESARGGATTAGKRRRRWRGALVIGEMATALVLLVGAGLLIKSFVALLRVEPGFETANLLAADLTLPPSNYPTAKEQLSFYQQLLEKAGALPGISAVSLTSAIPLDASAMEAPFSVRGRPYDASKQPPVVRFQTVGPDYFRTMGIGVTQGRDLAARDMAEGAAPVVFINEELARAFFPGEEVIGKEIKIGGPGSPNPWLGVAGVVKNVRSRGLEINFKSEMYLPYPQRPGAAMTLVARSRQNPLGLIEAIRHEVQTLDAGQPIYNVRTMEQVLAASVAQRRFAMSLFLGLALLALLLAAIGLYGVMSYAVAQRTHEIGVRLALGAQPADVLRLVVSQGMLLALAGLALGILGALAVTRLLTTLLYGVTATDPFTFGAVGLLLTAVAFVACYLPARRATKVDPLAALKYE